MNTVYAEDNSTDNSTLPDDFSSIQGLIDNANPGDSIHLENKTYEGSGKVINIDKDINIYGVDSSSTILDANSKSSIFNISKRTTVNVYGISFVNGKTTGNGAAIESEGILTIKVQK